MNSENPFYGVDLLVTLSNSDQPRTVLSVLDNLFPLLIASPDVVYNQPKLLDVVYRLIQTDFSYYKRAKNLLTFQFPGTVLQLLGSLMENTITKLNGYDYFYNFKVKETNSLLNTGSTWKELFLHLLFG